MFKKIKQIVSEQVGCRIEDVKKEARLAEDLDADSLDMVELVMEVEMEFNIEIHDKEMEKINTVDELMNLIVEKQGE